MTKIENSEQHKEIEYDYKAFVRLNLTKSVTQELTEFVRCKLESSELVLRQRSGLVHEIKRERAYDPVRNESSNLVGILEAFCSYADLRVEELNGQVEKMKKRKEELSKQNTPYDIEDKVLKAEREIYNLKRHKEDIGTRYIPQLKDTAEAYCLITPVNTEDYNAIRVVLPIDSEKPIISSSLIEYLYVALNTELAVRFHEEAFGECSIDDTVRIVTDTAGGRSYHAIDIIYDFSKEDIDAITAHLSEFISELTLNAKQFYKSKGVDIEEDDLAQANIKLKPFVFPYQFPKLINHYFNNVVEPEITRLCDDFKLWIGEFLATKLSPEVRQQVGSKALDALIDDTSTNSSIFLKLVPYMHMLEVLSEKHKGPLIQRLYSELLGVEYKDESNKKTDLPKEDTITGWIPKREAIAAITMAPKYQELSYRKGVEAGAIRVKEINDKEYAKEEDIRTLASKMLWVGKRVRGVYDEPVIAAFDVARELKVDSQKLNKLLKEHESELSDVIKSRAPNGKTSIYVLRNQPETYRVINDLIAKKNE